MDNDKRIRLSQTLLEFRKIGDERANLIEKRLAPVGGPVSISEIKDWEREQWTRRCEDSTPVSARHEEVRIYFDDEVLLQKDFGDSIIVCQVYRAFLEARSAEELRGDLLTELRYPGAVIGPTDTVATFERLLRLRLEEQGDLPVNKTTGTTLFLSGRPMTQESLFYADNSIALPLWIQCCLHDCERSQLVEHVAALSK